MYGNLAEDINRNKAMLAGRALEQHKRQQAKIQDIYTTRIPARREVRSEYSDIDTSLKDGGGGNLLIIEGKPSGDISLEYSHADIVSKNNDIEKVCLMEVKPSWSLTSQYPDTDNVAEDVVGMYLQGMTHEITAPQYWLPETVVRDVPYGVLQWLNAPFEALTFDLNSPLMSFFMPQSQAKQEFDQLVEIWKAETQIVSSVTEMVAHPAYQQIIGMGSAAVPLIIEQLTIEPDHWFSALKAITGEDPVPDDAKGDLDQMTKAWLEWEQRIGS